jgi:hypothetical protein
MATAAVLVSTQSLALQTLKEGPAKIVSVTVTEKPKAPEVIRVNISGYSAIPGKKMFVGVSEAMASPDMRQQVLQDAWKELQSWKAKYAGLKVFSAVVAAIGSVANGAGTLPMQQPSDEAEEQ